MTSRSREKHLARSLYERYVLVVATLIVVLGIIQWQSLQSALILSGENSLAFALRDAFPTPGMGRTIDHTEFRRLAPYLLRALSVRGINVRLYDVNLRVLGEGHSRIDPIFMIPLTRDMVAEIRHNRMLPLSPDVPSLLTVERGQILFFASLGTSNATAGYVELGYDESVLRPILQHQAMWYFLASLAVLLIAALLLVPVIRRPLTPLTQLIQTALRIREGAVEERLPEVGTYETVRLARVVNETLDRLAQAVSAERLAASRMKRFVSAASHELRTPLTAIRGFTEVLLRRVDMLSAGQSDLIRSPRTYPAVARSQWDEMAQGLRTVERETSRLESLVHDLLQLAKIDEGMTPSLEDLDLTQLVESLKPQFDMLASGRILRYDLTPAPTRCDASLMQQVVYNLVMNAIQHTQETAGQIVIRVTPRADQRAELVVSDNGSGIREDQLEHIFERFYRASGARERSPGGAGLGLAIVAEIVQAHGGTITAQSTLGVGTQMTVVV